MQALGLGVVGCGGFAGEVLDVLAASGHALSPPVRVVAVYEPAPDQHRERLDRLRAAGVAIAPDLDALLARGDVDVVYLPVPIGLHRALTERALAAGVPVLCEKPAAGAVQDVDAMIAARDAAGLPALVAFQMVYDPAVRRLERALLDGAIGAVTDIRLWACWPRSIEYYRRNAWAGRLRDHQAGAAGGAWVLDSPAQNALAHYLHLALHLAGPEADAAATPVAVAAELYRANPIESYDTASLRLDLDTGARVTALLTHACRDVADPVIEIAGTAGRARWSLDAIHIERDGLGRHRRVDRHAMHADPQRPMFEQVARVARGDRDPARGLCSLESARAHVLAVNGAAAAAPIIDVPDACVTEATRDGETFRAIDGVEQAFARCAARGATLHESGLLPFTAPPGTLDLRGFRAFTGPRRGPLPAHE